MKTLIRSILLTGVLAGLPFAAARADNLALPADAPPAFQAECGSCHLAFPPQLLGAVEWRQVMARLDKHYGDNASLDAPTQHVIEDFMVGHAGAPGKVGIGGTASAATPPRLTATPWFMHKHRKVSQATWSHEKVKSPANCAGCHTRAAEGSYREREISLPGRMFWERRT